MNGMKSVLGFGMARGEFGELTRGKITRFDCISKVVSWIIGCRFVRQTFVCSYAS